MSHTSKTPEIPDALLDQLLKDYRNPEDLLGPDGLMKALKKRLIEKALGAELTAHLGYEKSDPQGRGSGNSRNGASRKTLKSEDGAMEIDVPRDRAGSFEPQLVKKGDKFDIEVRIPGDEGGTSLAGGRLLETVLTETAIVPGRGQMKGHIVARALGPILVGMDVDGDGSEVGLMKRGKVLGGGISHIDRDMALYVKTDFRTFRNITRLTERIGTRFFAYDKYGVTEPLADAQTDQRIILKLHPSY